MGDLPTMVVATTVAVATTVVEDHRTTTMEEGARSPSTPLTCLAERSLVAAEVASLSIPLDCLEERNQAVVEGETETDRDLLMESQDPVEEEEAGQNPPMELVVAVGASFLASAFLTSVESRTLSGALSTLRRYSSSMHVVHCAV